MSEPVHGRERLSQRHRQIEDSGPDTTQCLCACAHSCQARPSGRPSAHTTPPSSVLVLQKTESGQGGQHQFIDTLEFIEMLIE